MRSRDPPEVTSKIEDGGFVDLLFRVTEHEMSEDGSISVQAEGLHKGTVVGFRASLVPGMKPGVVDGEIEGKAFRKRAITIERVDERSDALVSVISELYGIADQPGVMRDQLVFTALALAGDPEQVESQHLNFKIFHDEDRHGEYCELFFHIDLPAAEVEIHEKDDEYRSTVLKALTPRQSSWDFRCELKDCVPLPPEYTFDQALNYLNSKTNSFYILTRPDGSYMQCGGGRDRCTVELREQRGDGSYSHYVIGKEGGSTDPAAIQMSASEVQVTEAEVLDRWDAINLFKAFFAGQEVPGVYCLRRVEM